MTLPPRNFAKRNRDGRLRSPQHLAWVRGYACVAQLSLQFGNKPENFKIPCNGRIEACHLRDLAPLGHGGPKPPDAYVCPMCRAHHQESEKRERRWQEDYGLDLMALALEFAAKSPDPRVREAAKEYRESLLQR